MIEIVFFDFWIFGFFGGNRYRVNLRNFDWLIFRRSPRDR